MKQCNHRPRAGIVVNESGINGYNSAKPYVSRNVCHRPECQQAGIKWAAGESNERAVFLSNEQLRGQR